MTQSTEKERELYECVSCNYLYSVAPRACDCRCNPKNEYREWVVLPKEKAAKPDSWVMGVRQLLPDHLLPAKMTKPDLWVMKVPVISTVHIKPSTLEAFNAGTIASCDIDGTYLVWHEDMTGYEDLEAIREAVKAYSDGWIRLDGGAGSEVPNLPTYIHE